MNAHQSSQSTSLHWSTWLRVASATSYFYPTHGKLSSDTCVIYLGLDAQDCARDRTTFCTEDSRVRREARFHGYRVWCWLKVPEYSILHTEFFALSLDVHAGLCSALDELAQDCKVGVVFEPVPQCLEVERAERPLRRRYKQWFPCTLSSSIQ